MYPIHTIPLPTIMRREANIFLSVISEVTLSKLFCLLSEKGSCLKGKDLLPLGANLFLSSFQRRPLFQKWFGIRVSKQKSCLPYIERQKINQVYQVPLKVNRYGRRSKISNTQLSDKITYANSADPDQTASLTSLLLSLVRVYTICLLRNSCIKSKIYAK